MEAANQIVASDSNGFLEAVFPHAVLSNAPVMKVLYDMMLTNHCLTGEQVYDQRLVGLKLLFPCWILPSASLIKDMPLDKYLRHHDWRQRLFLTKEEKLAATITEASLPKITFCPACIGLVGPEPLDIHQSVEERERVLKQTYYVYYLAGKFGVLSNDTVDTFITRPLFIHLPRDRVLQMIRERTFLIRSSVCGIPFQLFKELPVPAFPIWIDESQFFQWEERFESIKEQLLPPPISTTDWFGAARRRLNNRKGLNSVTLEQFQQNSIDKRKQQSEQATTKTMADQFSDDDNEQSESLGEESSGTDDSSGDEEEEIELNSGHAPKLHELVVRSQSTSTSSTASSGGKASKPAAPAPTPVTVKPSTFNKKTEKPPPKKEVQINFADDSDSESEEELCNPDDIPAGPLPPVAAPDASSGFDCNVVAPGSTKRLQSSGASPSKSTKAPREPPAEKQEMVDFEVVGQYHKISVPAPPKKLAKPRGDRNPATEEKYKEFEASKTAYEAWDKDVKARVAKERSRLAAEDPDFYNEIVGKHNKDIAAKKDARKVKEKEKEKEKEQEQAKPMEVTPTPAAAETAPATPSKSGSSKKRKRDHSDSGREAKITKSVVTRTEEDLEFIERLRQTLEKNAKQSIMANQQQPAAYKTRYQQWSLTLDRSKAKSLLGSLLAMVYIHFGDINVDFIRKYASEITANETELAALLHNAVGDVFGMALKPEPGAKEEAKPVNLDDLM